MLTHIFYEKIACIYTQFFVSPVLHSIALPNARRQATQYCSLSRRHARQYCKISHFGCWLARTTESVGSWGWRLKMKADYMSTYFLPSGWLAMLASYGVPIPVKLPQTKAQTCQNNTQLAATLVCQANWYGEPSLTTQFMYHNLHSNSAGPTYVPLFHHQLSS